MSGMSQTRIYRDLKQAPVGSFLIGVTDPDEWSNGNFVMTKLPSGLWFHHGPDKDEEWVTVSNTDLSYSMHSMDFAVWGIS